MALFNKKKSGKETTKKAPAKRASQKAADAQSAKVTDTHSVTISKARLLNAIIRPRITEKASYAIDQRIYTFEVARDATKAEIKAAIAERFKVTPTKVNVATIPGKRKYRRGTWGKTATKRKAFVRLKEGETIDVI